MRPWSSYITCFYFLGDIFSEIQNMQQAFFPGHIVQDTFFHTPQKTSFHQAHFTLYFVDNLSNGIYSLIGLFHYADPPLRYISSPENSLEGLGRKSNFSF